MKVGVIGGGVSTEHEVSLASAAGISAGLRESGHHVAGLTIDPSGRWHRVGASGPLPWPAVASELAACDVVVPAGRVFVLGDHRDSSADSRCHLDEKVNGVTGLGGFPSVDSVVGAVAWTIFPFDRWRSHATPDGFAAVPDPADPALGEPVVKGPTPTC